MWYLCKEIFKCTPDDPRITDMDQVQKIWMFENWLADQEDLAELAKNHAYLLASFSNPEAVKELVGLGNKHVSDDQEFEESSNMVREMNMKLDLDNLKSKPNRRKRHKIVKG